MATAFDSFLQQAWADHADQAAAVAHRLKTQTPAPESPQQLAALARLVVHLCGEHLGNFDDGRLRLAALKNHPLADASVQSALRVGTAGLTLAESARADCSGLSLEELIRSQAAAAAISLGQHDTARAMSLLSAAREHLASTAQADAATHRALAVACNNMAWELHGRGNARTAADSAAMLDVAAASKMHWSHAGSWLEIERADYGLALCHVAAGRPQMALRFAEQCLTGCRQNCAPPYEMFYAHEALARAQHACGDLAACAVELRAAEVAFAEIPARDQDACRSTLESLRALHR